jgi:hypothetical protein
MPRLGSPRRNRHRWKLRWCNGLPSLPRSQVMLVPSKVNCSARVRKRTVDPNAGGNTHPECGTCHRSALCRRAAERELYAQSADDRKELSGFHPI